MTTTIDWKTLSVADRDRLIHEQVLHLSSDVPLPAYSSDLNVAWTVVERIAAVEANVYVGYVPHAYCTCDICYYDEQLDNRLVHGTGDSPAEAICVAALRALGIEVIV